MITALTTTAVRGWVTGPGTDELLPTSLQKRSRPGEAVPAGLGWAGLGWAPRPRGLALRFLNWKKENWKVSLGKIVETRKNQKDRILGWVRPRKSYVIKRKSVNSGLFFFFSLVSAKALGVWGAARKSTPAGHQGKRTVSFGEGKRWGETPRQRIKDFGLFSGDTATPPRPVGKAILEAKAPPRPQQREAGPRQLRGIRIGIQQVEAGPPQSNSQEEVG